MGISFPDVLMFPFGNKVCRIQASQTITDTSANQVFHKTAPLYLSCGIHTAVIVIPQIAASATITMTIFLIGNTSRRSAFTASGTFTFGNLFSVFFP